MLRCITCAGTYSNVFVTSGGHVADQTALWAYPYFEAGSFYFAEDHKDVLTLGELLTTQSTPFTPTKFKGRVFAIAGALDL